MGGGVMAGQSGPSGVEALACLVFALGCLVAATRPGWMKRAAAKRLHIVEKLPLTKPRVSESSYFVLMRLAVSAMGVLALLVPLVWALNAA